MLCMLLNYVSRCYKNTRSPQIAMNKCVTGIGLYPKKVNNFLGKPNVHT